MRDSLSYFRLVGVIVFLVSVDSAFSMQEWGRWYSQTPQPRGVIDAPKEGLVRVQRVDKRNALLSSDGVVYINNMYPVYSRKERQLVDILMGKEMMKEKDLRNVVGLLPASVGESGSYPFIAAKCDSLVVFLTGTCVYLGAFNANRERAVIMGLKDRLTSCLGDRDCSVIKCLSCYKGVCAELRKPSVMKGIWDLMHTERLWAFDKFFDKGWKPLPTQRIVSYYDMCEACEKMVLERLRTVRGRGIL